MNCTGVIHEISSYIDGELEAAVRIELEEHLRECEGCAIIVRQTKLTVQIFCDDKPVELPTEVRSRLHETLKRKLHKST
ncbi:MAG: zf-HC2 domain-containing protein [Acidobacteria bacterium]|nr:zf-HC2 domain-containing protein [Acidobacteriota bacterium]